MKSKTDEVRELLAAEHTVDEWDSTDATIIKIVEELELQVVACGLLAIGKELDPKIHPHTENEAHQNIRNLQSTIATQRELLRDALTASRGLQEMSDLTPNNPHPNLDELIERIRKAIGK